MQQRLPRHLSGHRDVVKQKSVFKYLSVRFCEKLIQLGDGDWFSSAPAEQPGQLGGEVGVVYLEKWWVWWKAWALDT